MLFKSTDSHKKTSQKNIYPCWGDIRHSRKYIVSEHTIDEFTPPVLDACVVLQQQGNVATQECQRASLEYDTLVEKTNLLRKMGWPLPEKSWERKSSVYE